MDCALISVIELPYPIMFNEEALSIGTVIIGELNYPSKN
jgi:hypothetical protein